MDMMADSNMGFQHGVFPSSFYNQHVVSFQAGAAGAMPGVMPGAPPGAPPGGLGGIGSTTGMILARNPGMISSTSPMITAGSSSSSRMLEQVPGLKHDTRLAVDWSLEEMAILKAGLVKYAKEPSIMKYVKIAAFLRDKSVRDVALRCRWMAKENSKRRKTEDHCAGKKMKERKEKMVDSSLNTVIQSVPTDNMAAYPFMMHHANQNNQLSSEVPIIDGVMRQLLEENAQVFCQITANLATFNIQDNIDLFCLTRNNITAILNSMNEIPGIMSQMPPLPVSVNEDLVNTILHSTNQALMFDPPSGIHLKQEPRC